MIYYTDPREDQMIKTISEMMGVMENRALDVDVLLGAVKMLPFHSSLNYDKFKGRWIYSNEDEDYWPESMKGIHVAGIAFSVSDLTPEMALARGIYYYYNSSVR